MASITMSAASFLNTTNITKASPRVAQRRLVVVANAAKGGAEVESVRGETTNNGRRDLMFAAAAAALCSAAGVAMAGEPKNGSPEAKKAYAPVCVTMPTAKICRN